MSEDNKAIEPTEEEPKAQAPLAEPPEETVGDIMQKSGSEALKWVVIVLSAGVYLAGIVYAEVHGLTMLQKGVAPEMRFWAGAGMVAAGVSAILYPIALKSWAIEAKHRIATTAFYVLDFAFLAFNAFTDFNTNAGQQLAPWAMTYTTYILPASPVIVAAMWAILWELDPAVKQKVLALTLRMAMREKMARKVADAAKGQNVSAVVNAAAEREVERALTELFGQPVRPVAGYVMNEAERPTIGGLVSSFFGSLLKRAQSALLPDTLSQSQGLGSSVSQDQDAAKQ